MGAIKTGWDFFQDQILGMHWLKDLIGNLNFYIFLFMM